MRLPYLQVEEQFITHRAKDMGHRLGVSPGDAAYVALRLWTWALSCVNWDAPDVEEEVERASRITLGVEESASLIALHTDWRGDARKLADVMSSEAVRLLEPLPDGFRVRGLVSRYVEAAEKGSRKRKYDAAVKVLERAGWTKGITRGTWVDPSGKGHSDALAAAALVKSDPARYKRKPDAPAAPPPPAAKPAPAVVETAPAPAPAAKPKPPKQAAPKAEAPAVPEPSVYKESVAALETVFRDVRGVDYTFDPRHDGKAINRLLWGMDKPTPEAKSKPPRADIPELERRFRIGLDARFPRCNGFRDLAQHWNAYAQPEAGGAPPRAMTTTAKPVTRGSVRAEAITHAPIGEM